MNDPAPGLEELRAAAAGLLLDWARCLVPHYGPSGSLDLDLADWPGADGPSFYNQFTAAALLLLADGTVPGATPAERERFAGLARRNLEYTASIVDADFRTPHFSRGRDWGRHIGEWLVYYQLSALEMLHAPADADLKERLHRAVAGATEAAIREFQQRFAGPATEFAGNHATWHALLFVRAGHHFGRADWEAQGREFMHRWVLPFQDASGGWPEGGGTVVGYSLVTAQAVSLFADLTGDQDAKSAVVRALAFHEFYRLPDASDAVVADVRMRRHPCPPAGLPPGFLDFPGGRRYALDSIVALRSALQRDGLHDNGGQGLAFFGSFCEGLWRERIEGEAGEIPRIEPAHAGRIDRALWVALAGWHVTPEWTHNRFVLDSQNFLEVWQAQAGYLIGTGNSKFMPRFSTFRRLDRGRAYIPDRAEGRRVDPGTLAATYHFGDDRLELTVRLEADACEITVTCLAAPSGATYEFGAMLALQPGDEVAAGSSLHRVKAGEQLDLSGDFSWRGLRWVAPASARLIYPVSPHNSYTQDGWSPAGAHVARLSFVVGGRPATLRIQS